MRSPPRGNLRLQAQHISFFHAGGLKRLIVQKLLAAGAKIEPLDRVKKNAAIYAAGNGCAPCLAQLLRPEKSVNARLENNLTLLMWAAGYGHEAVVRFLLEQGADRSLKDDRGKTAAEMARDGNHLSLAKLLEP